MNKPIKINWQEQFNGVEYINGKNKLTTLTHSLHKICVYNEVE
jgi:hypothetical protein